MRLRVAPITFAVIGIAIPVRAGCGFEPLWRSIDRGSVAAVFSGTVVGVESKAVGDILTLAVDTIWKGNVPRTLVVYHGTGKPAPMLPSKPSFPPLQILDYGGITGRVVGGGVGPVVESDFRPFDLSRRYVVVAYRMTDEERASFKVDGQGDLSVSPCGGILFDDAQAIGELDRVGPGRAPQ